MGCPLTLLSNIDNLLFVITTCSNRNIIAFYKKIDVTFINLSIKYTIIAQCIIMTTV